MQLQQDDEIVIVQSDSSGNSDIIVQNEDDKQQQVTKMKNNVRTLDMFNNHELQKTPRASYNERLVNLSPMINANKSYDKQMVKEFDEQQNVIVKQLNKEETQLKERFQIDLFITKFAQDSNKAIQYMIDQQEIDDDVDQIAQLIMNAVGLNKDAINRYFGSHKEKPQLVFKAFCRQMNFKGVEYLKALRQLLQKFRLAGEAQQVDRILLTFSNVYHEQNPTVFESAAVAHVLAYSIIMLSTDSANTKIAQKNKMTKPQFVKLNLGAQLNIPAQQLETIYDSIINEPLSTGVDYLEQMYNRMILCNEPLQGDSIVKALKQAFDLMKGSNVIKFGRIGQPQARKLFLSPDEKRICWKSISNENEPARYINVSDIYDIALGSNTTDIFKRHTIPVEFDMLCFSIITTHRTLDVRVNEVEIKSKWINYLRAVILVRRENEAKRAQQNLKRLENEQVREQIWKNDILPYWEIHWDYKKNRPENFKQYIGVKKAEAIQKAKNKSDAPSMLSSICSCLKKTITLNPIAGNRQQQPILNQNQASEINSQQVYQDQAIEGVKKNKSLLLMILWKLGIPDFVRKKIWPVVIGNRLELTPNLYEILLEQYQSRQQQQQNIQHYHQHQQWLDKSLYQIQEDFVDLVQQFSFLQQEKGQQLLNILRAFVFYRPDFGYIKGMGHLGAILVLHVQEYESFQAFINLIHQYHFLPIFTGDVRQIEWRVRYFEDNLKRILPLVYDHMKAMDANPKIYLIRMFMTIFASLFPLSMLSRVWDNFILEGEIYLFKVAISYMKYYQLELKMSNLDEINRILSSIQENLNEDYFFMQTDEIPIKEDEYSSFIQKQQAALLNTQVHQILLLCDQ